MKKFLTSVSIILVLIVGLVTAYVFNVDAQNLNEKVPVNDTKDENLIEDLSLNFNYLDFGNSVLWDNTGKNLKRDWWGYSLGVANAFESGSVPDYISAEYLASFGSTLSDTVPVVVPTLSGISPLASDSSFFVCIQHSSCFFSNVMKTVVSRGNAKIRIRVYMEAEGVLPTDNFVRAISFVKASEIDTSFGLLEESLQTLQPNVWTEFVFDIAPEYLEANKLAVAFNLINYYGCDESVSLKFYLGNIAFVKG